jgi:hypothetical protein
MNEALVEEAMKKSGLVWLTLPDLPQPRAAWHLWHEGAAYILTGGEGEQPLPGLPEASQVTVTVRSKDKGGMLVTWVADVSEIAPGSPEWDELIPLVVKERLNARPQHGEVHEGDAAHNPIPRWSRESWLLKLTPTGTTPGTPGNLPADYASVQTVPTPATNTARRPFMIGGKKRNQDR